MIPATATEKSTNETEDGYKDRLPFFSEFLFCTLPFCAYCDVQMQERGEVPLDRFVLEFSKAAMAVVLVLGVLALGLGVLLVVCPGLVFYLVCRILGAALIFGGVYALAVAWRGRRK